MVVRLTTSLKKGKKKKNPYMENGLNKTVFSKYTGVR